MKISRVTAAFVVIVLFSVSGVHSFGNGVCKRLTEKCSIDSECCSGNCRKYFSIVTKYCTDFHDHCLLYAGIKEIFIKPKFDDVECAFDGTAERSEAAAPLDRVYGAARAAYSGYEPKTVLTVKRDGKTFDVVVDDREVANGTVMLSGPAAAALDVQRGGAVPCQVQLRVLNNHPVLKTTLYVTPAVGMIVAVCALLRINLFAVLW